MRRSRAAERTPTAESDTQASQVSAGDALKATALATKVASPTPQENLRLARAA